MSVSTKTSVHSASLSARTAVDDASLTWCAVAVMLAALLIGAALVAAGSATTPEATAYISPVFTIVGVAGRLRQQ
ncbi:hypothetical protein [Streptomyces sp. NEAU-YJ-81]|uniref:hypothetical protein n=1 Tax=Streptomyces sp. NEAU-YJ-81 TaxID=2820288 RepID=UPI001ABC5D35|nr:hypothetical protein [Streptomyces sp. NEAU-YJ-81]MBO3681758.1 hypothetical protein [Streptomyces sp. NEAU-YJ-81]